VLNPLVLCPVSKGEKCRWNGTERTGRKRKRREIAGKKGEQDQDLPPTNGKKKKMENLARQTGGNLVVPLMKAKSKIKLNLGGGRIEQSKAYWTNMICLGEAIRHRGIFQARGRIGGQIAK